MVWAEECTKVNGEAREDTLGYEEEESVTTSTWGELTSFTPTVPAPIAEIVPLVQQTPSPVPVVPKPAPVEDDSSMYSIRNFSI